MAPQVKLTREDLNTLHDVDERLSDVLLSSWGNTALNRSILLDYPLKQLDRKPKIDHWVYTHQTLTMVCRACGHSWTAEMQCNDRLCPVCARKRAARIRIKAKDMLSHGLNIPHQWKFFTLTVEHHKGESLRVLTRRLLKGFHAIRRQDWWRYTVEGGFYVIEAKEGANGWHPHIHGVYSGGYVPQDVLSAECARQRLGAICYVGELRQHRQMTGLRYVLKYISKPPLVSVKNHDEYNTELRGVRMFAGFGAFYSLASALAAGGNAACPECGSEDIAVLMYCQEDMLPQCPFYDDDLRRWGEMWVTARNGVPSIVRG